MRFSLSSSTRVDVVAYGLFIIVILTLPLMFDNPFWLNRIAKYRMRRPRPIDFRGSSARPEGRVSF